MSHDHFPGLYSAHANGRFIYSDQTPVMLVSGDGRPAAPSQSDLRELAKFRRHLPLIGTVDIDAIAELPVADSWDEFDVAVYNHIATHLETTRTRSPSWRIDPIALHNEYELVERAKYGAKAAIGLMMATYEVVPKLVFRQDFENPDQEIGKIAKNAEPLFVDWMRLAEKTDGAITYAMTNPKSKLDGLASFFNMRFDPKWFEIINNKPRIITSKIPHMQTLWTVRDVTNGGIKREVSGPVTAYEKPKDILLGCPAARFVPKIHAAMIKKAISDGLFAKTYLAERARYGYEI